MTQRLVAPPARRAVREVVSWELFDTKQYPAAGIGTLVFFLNPNQASPLTSNVHASGQLTNPQKFDVYGLAIEIFPDFHDAVASGILDDWAAEKKKMREQASIVLTIGVKPYLIQPLKRIPEGIGFTGLSAGADETAGAVNEMVMSHGLQDVKHKYDLYVPISGGIDPIEIPPQQAFKLEINWDNPPVLNVTGRTGLAPMVRAILIGNLWRETQ